MASSVPTHISDKIARRRELLFQAHCVEGQSVRSLSQAWGICRQTLTVDIRACRRTKIARRAQLVSRLFGAGDLSPEELSELETLERLFCPPMGGPRSDSQHYPDPLGLSALRKQLGEKLGGGSVSRGYLAKLLKLSVNALLHWEQGRAAAPARLRRLERFKQRLARGTLKLPEPSRRDRVLLEVRGKRRVARVGYDVADLRRRLGARCGVAAIPRSYLATLLGANHSTVLQWERAGGVSDHYFEKLTQIDRGLKDGTLVLDRALACRTGRPGRPGRPEKTSAALLA